MPESSLNTGQSSTGHKPHSPRTPATRFPPLSGEDQPAPTTKGRYPGDMGVQSLAPKEMTFELPKLVDLNDMEEDKDTERRKRIVPRVRLPYLLQQLDFPAIENDDAADGKGPECYMMYCYFPMVQGSISRFGNI